MPCRCEQCCPDNPLPTWTEAHRKDCFARWEASYPDVESTRIANIAKLEERREAINKVPARFRPEVEQLVRNKYRAIQQQASR